MKKCKKLLAFMLSVLLAFACYAVPAFASSSASQYGLEATIVTDKESYKANEDIHVTVTVKNTNDFKVENVSMESLLPGTLTLKDGDNSTKTVDLEPGETLTLSLTAVKEKEETSATEPESQSTEPTETEPIIPSESQTVKPSESESVKPSETETAKPSESETVKLSETETQKPTQESTEQTTQGTTTPITTETTAPATTGGTTLAPGTTETQSTTGGIIGDLTTTFPKITTPADSATTAQGENPDTGDSMSMKTLAIAIIALLAVIAIVIILMYKYKKQTTKIISLVMCVAISASAITGVTFFTAKGTDDGRKSFTVEKVITVDGEETTVSAEVKYQENKIDPDTGIEFIYFTTSEPIDVLVGEKTAVTFEAKISNPQSISLDKIQVTDEAGNDVGYLYDNGVKPDESANDGIYMGTFELYSDKEKEVEYSAHLNGASAKKTIFFYIPVTDNEWNAFQNILDNLKDIEETHVGNSKELLDRAENYLKSNNEVENYTRGTETIQFTTKNGLKGMFTLPIESDISDSTKALSNFRLEQTSVQANSTKNFSPSHVQKIAVIQPYDGTDDRFTNHLEDSANKIAKETGATVSIFNGQETYEQFKHLQNFDMILINTHGSLDEESDTPLICFSTIDDNKELRKDNDLNRVFVDQNRLVYVLPSFFSFYYGCKGEPNSFKDAFMYLGGCYGLKSTALAEILMEAGIKCFVGYTNIVSFKFEREMANQLFDEMTKNNSVNDVFSTTFKGKTEDPNRPGTRIAKVGDYRVFSNPKPAVSFAGGQGTINNPYQIATAEQLDAVRYNLKSNFVLVNDIDLSEYENWVPIGGMKYNWEPIAGIEAPDGFQGTFDGQNHIISGLTIYYNIENSLIDKHESYFFGLFSNVDDLSIIKNVTFHGVDIRIKNERERSTVNIATISANGGIIDNCITSGNIIFENEADVYSPEISGVANLIDKASNCTNSVNINVMSSSMNDFQYIKLSGICSIRTPSSDFIIENCINTGNIICQAKKAGPICAGGITYKMWSGREVGNFEQRIKNSINYGNIEVINSEDDITYEEIYLGGIIGKAENGVIEHCANYGNIICKATMRKEIPYYTIYIGGIVGQVATSYSEYKPKVYINNCLNYGDLSGTAKNSDGTDHRSFVGGILGKHSSPNNYPEEFLYISNCYNACNSIYGTIDSSYGYLQVSAIAAADSKCLYNNYFIDTLTFPFQYGSQHATRLSRLEIEKAIQELGFKLPSELPNAS